MSDKENKVLTAEEIAELAIPDDFITPKSRKGQVVKLTEIIKEYASIKSQKACKEQREICANEFIHSWHSDDQAESETESNIRNAPSPE